MYIWLKKSTNQVSSRAPKHLNCDPLLNICEEGRSHLYELVNLCVIGPRYEALLLSSCSDSTDLPGFQKERRLSSGNVFAVNYWDEPCYFIYV